MRMYNMHIICVQKGNFSLFDLKVHDINQDGRLSEEEFTSGVADIISDVISEFSHQFLDNPTPTT